MRLLLIQNGKYKPLYLISLNSSVINQGNRF